MLFIPKINTVDPITAGIACVVGVVQIVCAVASTVNQEETLKRQNQLLEASIKDREEKIALQESVFEAEKNYFSCLLKNKVMGEQRVPRACRELADFYIQVGASEAF